jgi:cyclophilin family peptidyl-prolyl cis-trans isomerase
MHNPWMFTGAMGVVVITMLGGLYYQQSGAGNRSIANQGAARSDAVDQTQATATPTVAATGTPGPVRNFTAAPPVMIDPGRQYTATVKTNKGEFTVQLFAKDAPQTVNNFVFLAQNHFYDGLTFWRVVKDFVVQAGDPKGDGTGGPGYTIQDEVNNHKNVVGAVAMAKATQPNTAGSQFYVDLTSQPSLDQDFTVFGQVTSGMEVVQAIGSAPRSSSTPNAPAVAIQSITINPP